MSLATAYRLAQSRGLLDPGTEGTDSWQATVDRVCLEIRGCLADVQLRVFDDPCTRRVACCARQSGKSHMAARLMVSTALLGPDRVVWYVSDTVDNAVDIMWNDPEDGLPAVLQSLGLVSWNQARESEDPTECHYTVNLTEHKVRFRNGSTVRLYGADRANWSNFRGKKADLLVIDEMQNQEQGALEVALRSHLPDCFAARRGSIVCLGTVGKALSGVWYELATGKRQGWNHWHWTARDMAHLTPVWERQLAEAAALGIDTATDSEFIREKLGVWVADEQRLLHSVPESAHWDGVHIPDLVRTRCPRHTDLKGRCRCEVPLVPRREPLLTYAGLDYGGGTGKDAKDGDPCAVFVGSVSTEEGVIYERWSETKYCEDSDVLATWLRGLRERHGIVRFYADHLKMMTNDLSRLYGLPIEPTDKGEKSGRDEDLWHSERRAALNQGTMLLITGSELDVQLASLLRDPAAAEKGLIRTAPGQDDHAADSWRYAFRMIRTNHVDAPEAPLPVHEAHERRLLEEALQSQRDRMSEDDDGRHRTAGSRR